MLTHHSSLPPLGRCRHTARVTGAQTFAALGIEINKVRLMARHSGETLLRYVADAPLRSLRTDLGLHDPSGSTALVAKASSWRTPPALAAKLTGLGEMLQHPTATVTRHTTELARAQIAAATMSAPTKFIQNTTSAAVHSVRANNNAQTVCGWTVGLTCRRSRVRRTPNNHTEVASLAEIPWQLICKNCLPQERAAAAARDRHLEPLSGDDGEVSE